MEHDDEFLGERVLHAISYQGYMVIWIYVFMLHCPAQGLSRGLLAGEKQVLW